MEPEAVLELMSSAPRRYETVRAALRYRGDGPPSRSSGNGSRAARPTGARSGCLGRARMPPATPNRTAPSDGAAGCGSSTTTAGVWSSRYRAAAWTSRPRPAA